MVKNSLPRNTQLRLGLSVALTGWVIEMPGWFPKSGRPGVFQGLKSVFRVELAPNFAKAPW